MTPRDDTTEILASQLAASHESVHGSLIGRTLGKFTLVEELGRGGSGEVYRAEEVQLGRSVVVKVLRRDMVREGNRAERFLREVKLASRLDHPYAAHVYAFGAESDAVVWIAMEHVRGMTIDTLVAARGAMPPALFAPLFARLCEVVQTAHELGIVHRDIKGSNVMVVERAGQMLPKLLDFGIAKGIAGELSPSVPGSDDLTAQGAILGSPHYMAPEQWQSATDVDARADIYALGVLAYFCVAGRLPFAGKTKFELPQAHREQQPPPLPATVPRGVAAAIERAMAKSSDARWPDALAFAAAIRGAIGGNAPETVPLLDPTTRDTWTARGPQPVADAVVRLARATTTVDADAALHELVAITCRWFAVVALAQVRSEPGNPSLREHARAVLGRDDATPWLRLARSATSASDARLPGFDEALAATSALEELALRRDARDRPRTASALAEDIAALPEALRPLERLLDYQLVVGRAGIAERWQGSRRRDRDPLVVWGDPLADGEVALLDQEGRVVTKLSPLVQVSSPLPSAEPELFLLWRTGRGAARMVAAPWGYERDDDAAAHWLAALTTANEDTQVDTDEDQSPYPGLAAYNTNDARHFVGREREVEALVNRLVSAPMVAVLGASGAGKTSFMHAGVMPRLAEGYDILSLRPGRHPLRALAAVAPSGDDDETGQYNDDDELVARLRARGERALRGLVIIVDQLEEVVTLCSDASERERFAAVLARAASDRDAPVRVVVGLRDDFANIVETLAAFRGRFETHVLATPAPDALRRIIIEPARRAQVIVDDRVVDDMVAEVAGRAGSLPLLSFTASLLWQKRDRSTRRITYEAYAALGGVAGALSTYADQVYASLDQHDQETVRDLFARLVAADGTRIPIPRVELEQLPGARGVLTRLIDARLLVVRQDGGVDVVELVHECLATRWERLARWRSEDAAAHVMLGDVRTAARRWEESGRIADLLWRGEALVELRRLAARIAGLTELERSFAAASDHAAQRRRRMRVGLIAGTMVVLAGVAGSMAYLRTAADRNRSAAELSAERARSAAKLAEDRLTTSLIAQGRRELNDGRGPAALAYFGEALQRGADTPALRFMVGVAARAWPDEILVQVRSGVQGTAITASGFATGDDKGQLRFWSDDGKPAGDLAVGAGPIKKLVRAGDELVVVGTHAVAIVDAKQRAKRYQIATKLPVHEAQIGPAPDEIVVVVDDAVEVYGTDGKLRRRAPLESSDLNVELVRGGAHVWFATTAGTQILDTRTMQRRRLEGDVQYGPYVCPDHTTVVSLARSHEIRVFASDGTQRNAFKPRNAPMYVTCSASGDRVAAVSSTAVDVYDAAGVLRNSVSFIDSKEVGVVRIRGDNVWTGSLDGVLRRYRGNLLVASMPSMSGRLVELRVSDRHVIARTEDSTLVVLRAEATHLDTVKTPCSAGELRMADAAVGVICGDKQHVYIGSHHIGTSDEIGLAHAAIEPTSLRGAIANRKLQVFDPVGRPLAETAAHLGAIAFEDADRLLVAEPAAASEGEQPGLWRWTFASDSWQRVIDLDPGVSAIAVAGKLIVLGTEGKQVLYVGGDRVEQRVEVNRPVASLTSSLDGQRIAAQLVGGSTVILDAQGRVLRELEPADTSASEALDATGALLVRPRRGTLSVWDTSTGDLLLYDLDLFRYAAAARFGKDGQLELAGSEIATAKIAPDRRPIAEIVRDIECRVPLRVAGSRLEPRTVTCR